jgi:hypothetical protein
MPFVESCCGLLKSEAFSAQKSSTVKQCLALFVGIALASGSTGIGFPATQVIPIWRGFARSAFVALVQALADCRLLSADYYFSKIGNVAQP